MLASRIWAAFYQRGLESPSVSLRYEADGQPGIRRALRWHGRGAERTLSTPPTISPLAQSMIGLLPQRI